jgi:ribosomal protein S18 acetylase RimI-like enzyme
VGIAGLRRADGLKTQHRATLWGMYVSPTARRQGIGAALVRLVIEKAREQVEELNLTVAAHNGAAISLYEAFGFVIFGVDKRALKVEGAYVDEVLMRFAF